jgi:ubiquinol-cytochrome c reductase iron-sulfur subunit
MTQIEHHNAPTHHPETLEHPSTETGWHDDVPPNQDDHRFRLQGQPKAIKWAERRIAACFLLTAASSVALAVVYVTGDRPKLEALFLFLALVPLGIGLVLWARDLLPGLDIIDSRHVAEAVSSEEDRAGAERALTRGADAVFRRKFLVGILGLAGGLVSLAALFPFGFLGARPLGKYQHHTTWTPGARLVDADGRPVKVGDVMVNGILTVYPEGHVDDPLAQTTLINIGNAHFEVKKGREGWEQDGLVAFSEVCTHAGCPVKLYNVETYQLVCPCHQSTFDVLDGCNPVFGPAPRPLPQLPLAVNPAGYLVAQHDYDQPVGPGYWWRET